MNSNVVSFRQSSALFNQLCAAATRQVPRGYMLEVTEDEAGAMLVFCLETKDYKAGAHLHVQGLQCRLAFVVDGVEHFATAGHFREVAAAYARWENTRQYPTAIITVFREVLDEVHQQRYATPLPFDPALRPRSGHILTALILTDHD